MTISEWSVARYHLVGCLSGPSRSKSLLWHHTCFRWASKRSFRGRSRPHDSDHRCTCWTFPMVFLTVLLHPQSSSCTSLCSGSTSCTRSSVPLKFHRAMLLLKWSLRCRWQFDASALQMSSRLCFGTAREHLGRICQFYLRSSSALLPPRPFRRSKRSAVWSSLKWR